MRTVPCEKIRNGAAPRNEIVTPAGMVTDVYRNVPDTSDMPAVGANAPPAPVPHAPQVEHTPAVHTPAKPHERPHAPQFAGSDARLASQPVDAIRSQSVNPAAQEMPQTPDVHVAVAFGPDGHEVPQAPQLRRSVWVFVSQPFAAIASQSENPESHWTPQRPVTHVRVEFGRAGQTVPHAEQLSTWAATSTHDIPQRTSPAAQPVLQTNVPPAAVQSDAAPLQAAPQRPQSEALANEVSHPSVARALQSPKPAAHVSPQTPIVQTGDAFGAVKHPRAQPPQ